MKPPLIPETITAVIPADYVVVLFSFTMHWLPFHLGHSWQECSHIWLCRKINIKGRKLLYRALPFFQAHLTRNPDSYGLVCN